MNLRIPESPFGGRVIKAGEFSGRRLPRTNLLNTTVQPWRLKFDHSSFSDEVELLHAENITHDYPRHMHEVYSIGVVLQGTETTVCRGVSHIARIGSVITINAEEVHSSRSNASSYRLIKIGPKLLNQLSLEYSGNNLSPIHFRQLAVNDRALFSMLLKLHLGLEGNTSPLEQESEFIAAMGTLLSRQSDLYLAGPRKKKTGEDVKVKLTRDYLKAHYAENVSLSQLSSIINLSPFHLLRVFRDQVGFPPHEYQTQLRVAEARRLIRQGLTLSQTALETGFFDQSHLCRNFKRIVGVTPRQYFSRR